MTLQNIQVKVDFPSDQYFNFQMKADEDSKNPETEKSHGTDLHVQ
jgi:hypothetical protein